MTGSGDYGITEGSPYNADSSDYGYTGAFPGFGCQNTTNVPGSGSYLAANTGPLNDPKYDYVTTGGDAAIVSNLRNQPLKVCATAMAAGIQPCAWLTCGMETC